MRKKLLGASERRGDFTEGSKEEGVSLPENGISLSSLVSLWLWLGSALGFGQCSPGESWNPGVPRGQPRARLPRLRGSRLARGGLSKPGGQRFCWEWI